MDSTMGAGAQQRHADLPALCLLQDDEAARHAAVGQRAIQ
jgi:hypothetical protein